MIYKNLDIYRPLFSPADLSDNRDYSILPNHQPAEVASIEKQTSLGPKTTVSSPNRYQQFAFVAYTMILADFLAALVGTDLQQLPRPSDGIDIWGSIERRRFAFEANSATSLTIIRMRQVHCAGEALP